MKILTFVALCGLVLGLCGLVFAQKNRLYGNPDGIVFPGPINKQQSSSGYGLSIQRAKQINEIDTIEEFLNMIGGVPKEQEDILIGSRFGGVERSNAIIPVPAKCTPELQPVPFANNETETSTVYFPSCTRIKRCGGCCDHALLSCQPTASITKNFQVLVSKINDDGSLTFREKQIIPLEEHTRCKCDCRIKPEHCSGKQIYIEEECICGCSNHDEEEKCRRNNDTKLWDPSFCACRCREEVECHTGYYFNPATCRCEQLAFTRRFGNDRPGGFRPWETSQPRDTSPQIVPLDSNHPRRKNKDDPEYK